MKERKTGTHVRSTDPRKAQIVGALKAASNCRKVTMVEDFGNGRFRGNCLNPNPGGTTGLTFISLDPDTLPDPEPRIGSKPDAGHEPDGPKGTEKRRGMIADVYRANYGDCTLGGITSKANMVLVVGPGVPEVFDETEGQPIVKIVRRNIGGETYVHAEPFDAKPMEYMAGGNFIHSTDGRFRRHVCAYPISVHDRKEL